MIIIADFTVTASVDIVLTDAEIKKATKELQSKLAAALKPLELKVTAPSVATINQITQDLRKNIQGLISDTGRLSNAFRTLGTIGVQAFRAISAAKDALRANIRFLANDLLELNGLLNTSLGAGVGGVISVRVVPLIDEAALRVLPPVELPVIPVISQSLGTLEPLVVPIVPVLPSITLKPIEVPVVPILEPLTLAALAPIKIRVEPVLEPLAVTSLPPILVKIEASETQFRNSLQRVVAASQEAGIVAGAVFKRAFEATTSTVTISSGIASGKTGAFAEVSKVSQGLKDFARNVLEVGAALHDGDINAAEANKRFLELGLSSDTVSKKIREMTLSAEDFNGALESVGGPEFGGIGLAALATGFDAVRNSVLKAIGAINGFGTGAAKVQSLAEAQSVATAASQALAVAVQEDVAAVTELTVAQASLRSAQSSGSLNAVSAAQSRVTTAEGEAATAAEALAAAQQQADVAYNGLAAATERSTIALGENAVAAESAAGAATGSFNKISSSAEASGNKVLQAFKTPLEKVGGFFEGIGDKFVRILERTLIRSTIVAGIGIVVLTKQVEDLSKAFSDVFPDAAQGSFKKLEEFAVSSPLALKDVVTAVEAFGASLGLSADKALEFTKIITGVGQASGASSKQINAANAAIVKLAEGGVTSVAGLKEIEKALPAVSNIDVVTQIGKDLGITFDKAQKAVEKGLLPATVGIRAIIEVAQQLPGATNAADNGVIHLAGSLAKLKDTASILLDDALKPVFALLGGGNKFTTTQQGFKNLEDRATAFGQTLAKTIQELVNSFGPLVTNIFNNVKNIIVNISSVVPDAVAGLKGIVQVFSELSDIVSNVSDVLRPIVKELLDIIAAALSLSPIRAIIEGVAAGFIALKFVITPLGNLIQSLGGLFLKLVANIVETVLGVNRFSTATRAAATATTEANTATSTLAGSLSGALSIGIGIAVAAWQVYTNAVNSAKKAQDDALAKGTQGLNVTPSNPNAVADQLAQQAAAQKVLDAAAIKNRKLVTNPSVAERVRQAADPSRALEAVQAEKAYQEALKNRDKILQDISVRQDIVARVAEKAAVDQKAVLDEANKQNLDIFHVDPASEQTFIDKLTQGLDAGKAVGAAGGTAIGTAIGNGVTDAFGAIAQGIKDSVKDAFSAEDELLTAQENLLSAKKAEAGIDKQIKTLQDQQKSLQQDKKKITDEELDALDAVHNLERQITANLKEQVKVKLDFDRANEDEARNELLASAKIDLANEDLVLAKQKVLATQKALTDEVKKTAGEEGPFVNIAGLSLDAARKRLAAVRSTLAAQKDAKKIEDDATKKDKTHDELLHDALEAKVNELEAEQNVTDSKRAQDDLLKAANTRQKEYNDKIDELKATEADLRRDRDIAADDYQRTLKGEIGIKKQIKDIDVQLKDLADQRKDAANKVEDAEKAVAKAVADSKGDYLGILKATQDIYNTRRAHLTTEGLITTELNKQNGIVAQGAKDFDKIRKDLEDAAKLDLTNTVKAFIGPLSPDNVASITAASDPRTIQRIIDEALKDPTTSLHDIMKRIFRELHLVVPGFAKGGYIAQASTPFGRTVRVAEAGAEAILPLTNKSAMLRVLGDSRVLDPILGALPQVSLPMEGVNKSSTTPTSRISEQQRRKEQQEFAGYVADAIVARSEGGDVIIHQTFETGQYIDTNALARKAAKEADRAFRKRNN